MKLKVYTVDVQLPRWSKRLLLFTALSAAMAISVVAVVRAATSTVPNTFADGDTLSASKMNANFSALQTQLDSTNGALTTVQQTMLAPDVNGNVGVGTKSPFVRLQSEGPTSAYNSDGGLISAQVSGTSKRVNIGFDVAIDAGFVQSVQSGDGNRPLLLNPNGGSVGIGTVSPSERLEVAGNIKLGDNMAVASLMIGGFGHRIGRNPADGSLHIGGGQADIILQNNVGIKTTSPQYTLDVAGTIRGDNLTPSDRTLKKNIAPLPADTTARVQKLDGVAFEWDQQKTSGLSKKPQIGLIAQEVEKVFPSLVETDGKGIKSVHYMGVTAVLLEAVKAQQKQIEELKNHVRVLENRLSPTASAATKPVAGRRLARRDVL